MEFAREFGVESYPEGVPSNDYRWRDRMYDPELTFIDRQLARIFDWLEESGQAERTIVVLTADHGQGLLDGLERHGWGNHRLLYDWSIRVPLILKAPGVAAGVVVEEQTRTIDILPTLLELLDVPGPDTDGLSLLPLARGEKESEPRIAYADALNRLDDHSPKARRLPPKTYDNLFVATDGRWKLIHHHEKPANDELFDLEADPGETRNVASEHPEERQRLLAYLEAREPWNVQAPGAAAPAPSSDALHELGYGGEDDEDDAEDEPGAEETSGDRPKTRARGADTPLQSPRSSFRRTLLLWTSLGVGLRALVLALVGDLELQSDEGNYVYLALLWNHFGVYFDNHRFLWPPGYPAFLAQCLELFGAAGLLAARWIQVLASAAVGASTMLIARRAFDERAARVAGIVWCFYLPLAGFTHTLWNETLFLACFLPALLNVLVVLQDGARARDRNVVLAGLFLALALYVKELPLYYSGVLALLLFGFGRHPSTVEGLRRASLFLLTLAVLHVPWGLRNLEVYGRFVPVGSSLGENAYVGLNGEYRNYDLRLFASRRVRPRPGGPGPAVVRRGPARGPLGARRGDPERARPLCREHAPRPGVRGEPPRVDLPLARQEARRLGHADLLLRAALRTGALRRHAPRRPGCAPNPRPLERSVPNPRPPRSRASGSSPPCRTAPRAGCSPRCSCTCWPRRCSSPSRASARRWCRSRSCSARAS